MLVVITGYGDVPLAAKVALHGAARF